LVDFLSVMLVGADAVNRGETQPIDLSMLRNRSVTRMIMRIAGEEAVGPYAGELVRVEPPDKPKGGIAFVIAKTEDGASFRRRSVHQQAVDLSILTGCHSSDRK
jgi:hypothetical protein